MSSNINTAKALLASIMRAASDAFPDSVVVDLYQIAEVPKEPAGQDLQGKAKTAAGMVQWLADEGYIKLIIPMQRGQHHAGIAITSKGLAKLNIDLFEREGP